MTRNLVFVRLASYSESNGHFNVLLRNQFDGCLKSGIKLKFEDLSPYPKEIQIDILLTKISLVETQHVYFEWLHDIPNLKQIDSILHSYGITWSVTASISELWNVDEDRSNVYKMLRTLDSCKSLATVFVFDDLLIERLSFKNISFTPIPHFENMELDEIRRPCCSWLNSSNITIGIVGQLYGYRGLNRLITVVLKKRNTAIFLWGQERWSSVGRTRRFMLYHLISNKRKFIFDNYLSSDAELNHSFLHIDALFIDGSTYSSPSGIAIRARNLGIPVLVEDGECYLKAKSKFDQGIVVGHFSRMSQRELESSIALGKSASSHKEVSKIVQQKAFIDVWSKIFV